MKCYRCGGEIVEGPADVVDELLIRQLIHDRDECPGPFHSHIASGVYGGCPACGTEWDLSQPPTTEET